MNKSQGSSGWEGRGKAPILAHGYMTRLGGFLLVCTGADDRAGLSELPLLVVTWKSREGTKEGRKKGENVGSIREWSA